MLVDYLHKRKFPIFGPIATWTLRTATVGVLVGVYQFNTNDIGMYQSFPLSGLLYRNNGHVLTYLLFQVSPNLLPKYGMHSQNLAVYCSSSVVKESKRL
jgi:hypothetical protein